MQFPKTILVTLRSDLGTKDPYGNQVLTDSPTEVWPAEYQQVSTNEQQIDRDTVVTEWLVLLPPTAQVDAVTGLTIDGFVCEVIGTPELVHHPWTRADDHWELTARRTVG